MVSKSANRPVSPFSPPCDAEGPVPVSGDKETASLELGAQVLKPETAENAESDTEESWAHPEGRQLVFIVVSVITCTFLLSMDMTIVATAIPKITDEFHGLSLVSWYSTAYFMCVGGSQSPWGKVYKFFPLKTTYLLSLLFFEVGSVICGAAPNATALIIGRALAGLSASGINSGTFIIIGFSAPPKYRALLISITGAAYGVASVVAPLLGGVFSNHVTWRWSFYINLPIGAVAGLLLIIFFQTPAKAKPQQATLSKKLRNIDPLGAILLMAAIVCFLLGFQWGGQAKSWGSGDMIGVLVSFGAIMLLFCGWEYWQRDEAMIPFRLLSKRSMWVPCLYTVNFAGSYFIIVYYLPIYFQSIDGASPISSGVRNIPLILAVMLSTALSGIMLSRLGYTTAFMAVGAAVGVVASGLFYTFDVGSSSAHWISYQVLAGLGFGLSFQVPIIVVQNDTLPSDLASVTSMVLTFQMLGGAFYISAAQCAFVNRLVQSLESNAPTVSPGAVVSAGAAELRAVFPASVLPGILLAYLDGIRLAFLLSIVGAGAACVLSLAGSWKRQRQDSAAAPIMAEMAI